MVRRWAQLASDPLNTSVLISLDDDDHSLSSLQLEELKSQRIPVTVVRGARTTKIGAMNRDMDRAGDWDIVIAASDDMSPVMDAYDDRLREDMATYWPNGDGCLWYSDGQQDRLCTMSIMDRKYFDRTGKIYYPGYKSYCCDDEYTEVAVRDGRVMKLPAIMCVHEHPCWGGAMPDDSLYQHNRTHKAADQELLRSRRILDFPYP